MKRDKAIVKIPRESLADLLGITYYIEHMSYDYRKGLLYLLVEGEGLPTKHSEEDTQIFSLQDFKEKFQGRFAFTDVEVQQKMREYEGTEIAAMLRYLLRVKNGTL